MVQTEIKVRWGEMDSFNHVNNIYFIRYMETGRIEYFSAIGLGKELFLSEEKGIAPILKKIECIYQQPVNYPATLLVNTAVTSIGNTSLLMEHKILNKENGTQVAEGESVIVLFDYAENHPVAVPEHIRSIIEKEEGKQFPPKIPK